MFWNTTVEAALWSHRVSNERRSENGVIVPESSQCHCGMKGLRGPCNDKKAKSQTGLALVPIGPTPSPFLGMIEGGFAEDLGSSLEGPHFLHVIGSSTGSLISES